METKEFIQACESAAYRVLTAWAKDIRCCSSPWKRQFNLTASHSWGSAYCDWDGCKPELFTALKQVGAVNLCGKVGWNYVDIYFDMSKKLIK